MSLYLSPLDDRLELKGVLGEGGMGQVHRAWDQGLERAVAVKFVRGMDPEEAEHLLLEARLQARVEHPHVVRVHEVGTLGGRPCIVMQLVEGGTLATLAPTLPIADRVRLLQQAAQGLHAAHLQGLVHRDVKPGNVLVAVPEEGPLCALVSDFGLARDEEGGLTRSGLPAGTLDYMAPEVLLGLGPVDFRVDVYGLGATTYALLSGHLPFRVTASRQELNATGMPTDPEGGTDLLRRILEVDPEPLQGVPQDLRTIVAKAMEKAPVDRYASAEAFADDLGRFLKGESIRARPATGLDRLQKWSRRNPTAARASVSAMLAIALGLGYGYWTTRRAARQSLEAAQLGALAESMEARVRMENLAPAHNLMPILNQVRSEAQSLKVRAASSGPAAFALGRAQELLGDWSASRTAYQQAWDQGYRSPSTAEALGLALIRVYDQDLRRARGTLAPEAYKARLAQLDHTLREPAQALLALGDPKGWRQAWAQAQLDMLVDDFESARQHARSVRNNHPQQYEAWTLEGEIWIYEGGRRSQQNRLADATRALDAAEPVLEQALAWGRSDNRPRAAMASLHRQRATLLQMAGQDPQAETQAALHWIDQALTLTPERPELLLQRAAALHRQAMSPQGGDMLARAQLVEEALRLQERANTLRPESANILVTLADFWAGWSTLQISLGRETRSSVEKGLARLQEAARLAPEDPLVPHTEVILRNCEVTVLRAEGKDPEPAIRAGLAAAERALQLHVQSPVNLQTWKIEAQIELGREAWKRGRDPRPDLMNAATAAEALLQQSPKDVNIIDRVAGCLWSVGDLLTDSNGDVDGLVSRTFAVLDQGLAVSPDYKPFLAMQAKVCMLDAYWRCIRDQDPTARIAASRAHLDRVGAAGNGLVLFQEVLAVLSLMEARWDLHQGRSPERALADVERRLEPLLKNQASSNAGALQNLALVALVRGQWGRTQQRSPEAQAQKGLAFIGRAIQLDAGDPGLRLVEARLHALRDRAAATRSLDEARRLNPLIAEGAEFRRALAEIAAR